MRKLLLIGSIVLVLGLIAGIAAPIFAHDPDDGGTTPTVEAAWEALHEACEDGDWEAMVEAAEEVHGEDLDDMPCHDEDDDTPNRWGGMGGHMGRGMM